ncbi:MAG: collagen-like protein, partial [Snowella sp.]
SFSKFAQQNITLSLAEEGKIQVTLSPDLWLETRTQQQENLTELVVDNAILREEATQLASEGISGNGTDLQLTLTDRAGLSNLVATKFRIKYQITRSDPRFRPVSDYTTKYEGEMPAELVKFNNNRFTFDLGKLPIEPQNFREGLGIQVEVVATRTFAGYSAEQTVVVKDVIGPFR